MYRYMHSLFESPVYSIDTNISLVQSRSFHPPSGASLVFCVKRLSFKWNENNMVLMKRLMRSTEGCYGVTQTLNELFNDNVLMCTRLLVYDKTRH